MNHHPEVSSPASSSSWIEFPDRLKELLVARNPGFLRSALKTENCQLFSSSDLINYVQRNHDWLRNSPKLQIVSSKTHSKKNELRPLFDSILDDNGPDSAAVFLLDCFCSGHTIVLNHLDRCWPSVGQLLNAIEDELRLTCNCNTYLTRAYSQGFEFHSDEHDVLVIQTQGSKLWQFQQQGNNHEGSSKELPLPGTGNKKKIETNSTSYRGEVKLHSGDMLYLPQGCLHRARTEGEDSVHLTISFQVPRNFDRAIDLIEGLSTHHASLRNRIWNSAKSFDESEELHRNIFEEIRSILTEENIRKSTEKARPKKSPRSRFSNRTGEQILRSMLSTNRINSDSYLKIPTGHIFSYYYETDGKLYVRTTRALPLPDSLFHIVDFLAANDCFKVLDLPAKMEDKAKVRLCQNLARKGLYIWANDPGDLE